MVRPLASNRDRICPTSPRRTASGLRMTRVRSTDMARTLPRGELPRAPDHVLRHGAPGVHRRHGLPGHPPQGDVAGPAAGRDVLGIVDRTAVADLERRLVKGYGEDRRRRELLAGVGP